MVSALCKSGSSNVNVICAGAAVTVSPSAGDDETNLVWAWAAVPVVMESDIIATDAPRTTADARRARVKVMI